MSQWIPTLLHDSIPAASLNPSRKQIMYQWHQARLIFRYLESKFLLLLTWVSGPVQRPLPDGQCLLQNVSHRQWIGTSNQTEKVRKMSNRSLLLSSNKIALATSDQWKMITFRYSNNFYPIRYPYNKRVLDCFLRMLKHYSNNTKSKHRFKFNFCSY